MGARRNSCLTLSRRHFHKYRAKPVVLLRRSACGTLTEIHLKNNLDACIDASWYMETTWPHGQRGHLDTKWPNGCMGAWPHVAKWPTWTRGHIDTWPSGYVGAWTHGRMDASLCNRLSLPSSLCNRLSLPAHGVSAALGVQVS